jgi:folate-dependent phosphoribosylglycinamide formyltransferase PurN
MVHEAIAEVDAGPVIAQAEVPIHLQDTLEELEARVHATEHRLLVEAIRSALNDRGAAASPPNEERQGACPHEPS